MPVRSAEEFSKLADASRDPRPTALLEECKWKTLRS
jgi:hypothetical protein